MSWPRGVVFDLDGTLVDSVGDLCAALNVVLAAHGLDPHTPEEVRRMVGGGARVLLQRAWRAQGRELGEADAETLARDFLAAYQPRATQTTRLYPGAAALIEELSQRGIALAVCTNKPTQISEDILRALGVLQYFGAVVGLGEGRPRKPDPSMLNETLHKLDLTPAEAVMIGDSAADVGSARGAGLPVIAVAYGYTATPPAELGADAVIQSLAEAGPALARLAEARPVPQM